MERRAKELLREGLKEELSSLFGYALALAASRSEAEELLQDTAVKALATAAVPRDQRAIKAWLFRILRNTWIDRRRRTSRALLEPLEENLTAQTEYSPGEARLVSILAVRQAVRRLPEPHRDIIALVDLVGFSYAEAATILRVPQGTVMSRLSRARRALLEQLEAPSAAEVEGDLRER